MRVAAVQHDIEWESATQTRDRVRPMIAQAVAGGARLVALPEMFATGFSMRPERIAEDEGGPSERFLCEQAREHDAYLLASIAQRGADGGYRNNAVLARPDGTVHRYAKIHPFSYAGEHEKYTAGTEHLTLDVDGLRVSLFVCYDLRFADEFWALARDTDLYVVVANWPAPRHEHWRLLLRARAVENQAYVLGVNRVGAAKDLGHDGGSALIDPLGRVVVEAGAEPVVVAGDVAAATVAEIRANFPFLADRR
ncbi:Predicted amidohydrolase [Jatrophihabitans endophyticus]|uniref:Predicted amidohydrolase n=1 Tax=Jatrophihabitans endophyticus TaxID=1206085 RepID=A0A1M5T8M7_9ACTN|nr:nitrilase-related carbon-nitrogen hydrolase [Jatrophihabitans endophyticus]SHH47079.1 Predicted amidohydrolase [Jatrophihabitans endophyticus]